MQAVIKKFACDESGATAIEYGLIAVLVAVAIVGSITALGGENGGMWNTVKDKVVAAIDGSIGGGEGE